MFSIVICSVNPACLSEVKESIRSTIGAEFELLIWDNRQEKLGLCAVYNMMAEKARFPYICFLHEDILFTTAGWGIKLAELFREYPLTSLVGVAGGKYKSSSYSGWYTGQAGLDCFNITHRVLGLDEKAVQPPTGESSHRVVCIDGVFMCCKQEVWRQTRFDEILLKGFHFYDIDFSLRVARRYEVRVAMNIDLVHITQGGDYGDAWIREAIVFHDHWQAELPFYLEGSIDPRKTAAVEFRVAGRWLDRLKVPKISWRRKFKWIADQKLYKRPSLWYPILRFLVYEPLGLRRMHNRLSGRPSGFSRS